MDANQILEEFRVRLRKQDGQFNNMARHSRLSRSWIRAFLNGTIDNPTIETLEELDRALRELEVADGN